MNILTELKSRFRLALAGLVDSADEYCDQVRPSQDPKFGDYQANLAMPLGKLLKRSPRIVAEEIVRRVDLADICQAPEIAGPGFINLRLKNDWIVRCLSTEVNDERLGVSLVDRARTYVIDFSAPNVAKPMHVGHIRSTVIGDALCRTLRFLGHRVLSDNHIGDWGTQFGMIIYGYKNFLDPESYRQNPVRELARLYRLVRQIMEYQENSPTDNNADSEISRLSSKHPKINAAALEETAKLHAGDPENRRLWEEFLPHCEEEINRLYKRLDVHFDHTLGESFYEDRLQSVVDELIARNIARESDGAICVFLKGQEAPMIVRKQDGAFL
ncbi:MAG: arginine--tRNA ligase domain-containing protein, partial [Thermoguttaceae bacterium]